MLYQSKTSDISVSSMMQHDTGKYGAAAIPGNAMVLKDLLKLYQLPGLEDILGKLGSAAGKKSFLIFEKNKYMNILTKNIAFFYIRYESPIIVTFDKQEYFVHQSLEQIQAMLPEQQFFRINRQYLINFNAVKEAEHYFARKLLVNLTVPTKEKLIVSKERVSTFLHWLDNR